MKTIKVIDLLNKIANGEEVPDKIKLDGYVYEFKKDYNDYFSEYSIDYYYLFGEVIDDYDNINDFLNTEVEIIEEHSADVGKVLEKINDYTAQVGKVDETCIEDYIHRLFEQQSSIIYRLNRVIDKINEMRD